MIVRMTARATGPFGELERNARIGIDKYPVEYLAHLVDIGVADVVEGQRIEHREPAAILEPVKKKPEQQSFVSRQDRALQKKIARKSKAMGKS